MAIIIPKYQSLFFKSLEDRTISTGSNLITNGKFTTDLSNWNIDSFVWDSTSDGIASAYSGYGIGTASLEQDGFNLQANNRYKLQFKYKASKQFKVTVMLHNNANAELSEDISFVGITDGFWHTVELYYNINIITTGRLILVAENIDAPGIQQGISFDDVSIYAQQSITNCGDCDTVIMDSNKPIEFQIKGQRPMGNNLYPNGTYDMNPFNAVTSSNLDFTAYPTLSSVYMNHYFTLYIADKVYFFGFYSGSGLDPEYTNVVSGNVNHIKIRFTASNSTYAQRLESALTGVMDVNHGTTSTRTGYNISIAGIPAGSYLHDPYSMLMSISTVTPPISALELIDGYYNSTTKQIDYYFVQNNVVIAPPVSSNNVMSIKEDVALTNGLLYRVRYGYTTIQSFNHTFNLRNSSNVVVFTQSINPLTESFTGGTVTHEFICPATDTYTLEFLFTPTEENAQLAFDNVTAIELKPFNINLQSKDCQGNLTTLPHTQIISGNNALIQINNADFPTNTPFQIIINDSQTVALGLQHFSENIQLIDFNNTHQCNVDSYVKLNWSDTCLFKDIDYKNLPFENEFYLRGFIQKQPIDKKERILFTQPDGSLKTIFNHSYAKAELRIGPYGKDVHAILERAIEHAIFKIDDAIFYLDEGSSYTISAIGNGNFMARVELVEAGSEVVKSSCCC